MSNMQTFESAESHYPFEKQMRNIINFKKGEYWYGSLVMDAVIFGLAIYFIYQKRVQRFEWTIIVCMFSKYTLYALQQKLQTNTDNSYYRMMILQYVSSTLGPICHWFYASQYLKTCFLVRGIVERAFLLFQKHKTIL